MVVCESKRDGLSLMLTYAAGLLAAASYGVTLTLPLYVSELGGNEATAGRVLFAGAVGTLACVPFAGHLADRYTPHRIAALASVVFGVGMFVLAVNQAIGPLLYVGGFLLGCGWGVFFTSTPMVVARLADEGRRGLQFSILSGFQMIGIGGGPVAAGWLSTAGVGLPNVFLFAATGNLVAAGLLMLVRAGVEGPRKRRIAGGLRAEVGAVFASRAIYPLVMVFFGACVFGSMFNFQTTFAASEGLDYAVFYAAYTVVVVASRFTVARLVGRMQRDVATIGLLAIMSASIAGFLVVGASNVVYAVAAALLGLGYGLVYPLIQAQAVGDTPPERHTLVLTIFSLSYFVGVFGFPLLGGIVIVKLGYVGMLFALLALALAELAVAVLRARDSPVRAAPDAK